MKAKEVQPDYLIDISGLAPLQGITYAAGKGLTIGAATKLEVIERTPVIWQSYHALYQAVSNVGSAQIRAMGSIGGNCCNALAAADTPPPLVALGAKAVLVSKRGRRELPLQAFIRDNSATAMEPDEFLQSLVLHDPWPHSASRYLRMGLRQAMEIIMASVAVNLALDPADGKVSQVRIVMGAVGPTPLRARRAEEMLVGRIPDESILRRAAAACAAESRPIDDFRASAAYRREVVKALARRGLQETAAAIADGTDA
jgi:carbon-monoxide dehydrogenase medium subunit